MLGKLFGCTLQSLLAPPVTGVDDSDSHSSQMSIQLISGSRLCSLLPLMVVHQCSIQYRLCIWKQADHCFEQWYAHNVEKPYL